MANEKNLNLIQSGEEAREKGRKGGIKSGETRRLKRSFRETLEEMLRCPSEHKGQTYQDTILASAIKKAENGDIKAMEFIRDTIGQKPIDKVDTTTTTVTRYITKAEEKAPNKHIDDVIKNGTR